MEVQPKNPTAKGPADWFTGDVWIDAVAQGHGPTPLSIGLVRFHAWSPHRLAPP